MAEGVGVADQVVAGDIKLADFGLAIGAAGSSHQLINYVVTRWYRAPELLLDKKEYTVTD